MQQSTESGLFAGGNRRFVLAAVFVAALVLTAGCTGILSSSADSQSQVEKVPEGTELMVHLDMAVLTDSTVQEYVEEVDEAEAEDVEDVDELTEEFYAETGLDPTEVDQALFFGSMADSFMGEESFGVILDTSWDAEAFIDVLEDEEGMSYVQTEYHGEAVLWEPADPDEVWDPVYVGVHDDGQLVLGDRDAVTASLDVTYGGENAVSGTVLEAFNDAPDGLVTFAMGMDDADPTDAPVDEFAMFDGLTAISGSFYTSGSSVGVEAHVHFASSDQADDMAGTINFMLSGMMGDLPPEEQELLDSIDVDSSGNAVVIVWEDAPDGSSGPFALP
ncbi:hypothetical protein [Halovivax gelatinilyticus]|uniref:hypothetical protein n=1 Tax=Halovivax gelatinilyticus TaxID=2961597 RepID=UPI0020CA40FE|nr:hypothetical protein [Halovivax gelatinilyticus]